MNRFLCRLFGHKFLPRQDENDALKLCRRCAQFKFLIEKVES